MHEFEPEDKNKELVESAKERILEITKERKIVYQRQIDVLLEDDFFHWITNHALSELCDLEILAEHDADGMKFYASKDLRYWKRDASNSIKLVKQLAQPEVSEAIGDHLEGIILDAFAQNGFLLKGRSTKTYNDITWTESNHNLDFIFERDGRAYGIEVKNTLGYMERGEHKIKQKMCAHLGIRPVFCVRFVPKSWIFEVKNRGGFTLVIKYQLFPPLLKDLASQLRTELGLPTMVCKKLQEGTFLRFLRWHEKQRNASPLEELRQRFRELGKGTQRDKR